METNRNRRLDITEKLVETEEKQNKDFSPMSALRQIQKILEDKDLQTYAAYLHLTELYRKFPQEEKDNFVNALAYELTLKN